MGSFCGSFKIRVFSLSPSMQICVLLLGGSSVKESVCDGWAGIFNTGIHGCNDSQAFLSNFFLSCVLFREILGIYPPLSLLHILVILFHVIYPFILSVIFSPSPFFLFRNCFASVAWFFVLVHSPLSNWKNFLSLFWNVRFWLYCLTLLRYLSSLPPFTKEFWFIISITFLEVIFYLLLFLIPTYPFVFIPPDIFVWYRTFSVRLLVYFPF